PTFRLDRRGEWLPTICRFGDRLVQMRLGGSEGRELTEWSWSAAMAKSRFIAIILLPFGSGLRVSSYRRRVALPANSSSRRVNGLAEAQLGISKSSNQADDLRGGMWQTGHTRG